MKELQIHPYSKFVLLTGFRIAAFFLGEGLLLYLLCTKYNYFFLLSTVQAIAPLALRLMLLFFGGALLSEYFLRMKS